MSFSRPHTQTIPDVLNVWRQSSAHSFAQVPQFDRRFARQFAELRRQAASGALDGWKETPEGCLGFLILLDQSPRKAFRASAGMYAQARYVARQLVRNGFIAQVPEDLQLSYLLPLAHSENLPDQMLSVELHKRFLTGNLEKAGRHWDIIDRFNRFPHRNAILGRPSRPGEVRYLQDDGFRGMIARNARNPGSIC